MDYLGVVIVKEDYLKVVFLIIKEHIQDMNGFVKNVERKLEKNKILIAGG